MKSRFRLIGCFLIPLCMVLMLVIPSVGCNKCTSERDGVLREYYISVEPWDDLFDDNGIPLVDLGGNTEPQYDPTIIAQHAIANYDMYLESCDDEYKEIFINQADWLLENLAVRDIGNFYAWEYRFDHQPSDVSVEMKTPWISAVAQSQGISVLLRAYGLTDDDKYLHAANNALEAFEKTIAQGGITYIDADGQYWYEEYPSSPPSHVLNGFIYALFGLYDLYQTTGDTKALTLFDRGVETLEENLGEYDTGSWSKYYLPAEWGSCRFSFRFKTDGSHPKDRHPIDEISIVKVSEGTEEVVVSLGMGQDESTDGYSTGEIYYDPLFWDWSRSYLLDGRTVRNYEDYGGEWAAGSFALLFPIDPSEDYYLDITYKDLSDETVYVEALLVRGWPYNKKFFELGEMPANSSGEWLTSRVEIPSNVLSLGCATSVKYHRLHIEQIEVLYSITEKDIFQDYASIFKDYLKEVGL